MVELTEEGRRLKREYYREYYRKNNRKIRDSRNSYWNKKAARSAHEGHQAKTDRML